MHFRQTKSRALTYHLLVLLELGSPPGKALSLLTELWIKGEIGQYFQEGLHSLKGIDSIVDIRNDGLIGAVQFSDASHGKPIGFDILKQCYDKGVMVRSMGNTIALSPPLVIKKEHIDVIVDTLDQVAKDIPA
ncbi:aminotransferase class III-fold pyridoxal phosphate-dependent enzyme [Vibrio sp. DNB22_19_2]